MGELIGKILGKETFKTAPGRYMTYIHFKALKTTDQKALGFSQIECDFPHSKKVKNLTVNQLIYVQFSNIRQDIHDGRIRNTIESTNVEKGKRQHFRKIDYILKTRRDCNVGSGFTIR